MERFKEEDLRKAHKYSSRHRLDLENDQLCGCFYCLAIFQPTEIEDWLDDDNTAECPYCGIDSVIGESSGFPITKEFLQAMYRVWF